MNPPQAERASAPPTLTRRTPSAEMSLSVNSLADPTSAAEHVQREYQEQQVRQRMDWVYGYDAVGGEIG